MRSPGARLRLLGVAFTLVVVAGVIVFRTAPPPEFGWFAYAPLAEEVGLPASPTLSPQQLTGTVIAALGLAGAAGTLGYLLGSRSAAGRQRHRPSPTG